MTIRCAIRMSRLAITWASILSSCLLLMTATKNCCAEEITDKAESTLNTLKQRSAEERWQQIKKHYPSDPAASRRRIPSKLPADHAQASPESEFEAPPSPNQTQLIPRLTALPTETSDDWVLPAQQPTAEPKDGLILPAPTPTAIEDKPPHDTKSKTPVRIAAQNNDANSMASKQDDSKPTRALHERSISEITPYYDRDRDMDIREFAIEKGKELDIMFKPKAYTDRSFPEITLAWEASNLTYYPLYFSDPALERYGHSYHPLVQPIASIARAGAQFVMLPYQMTINPPCKEESPLGWYRPGDCAPKLHYQVPLNAEAAVVEAGVVTGLFFIIP